MPKSNATKKAEVLKGQVIVRGYKKDCYVPIPSSSISMQFHIELGEKNQTVIVEDRSTDWVELANRDVDSVGIANILKLATKGLIDPKSLMFKDEESIDVSGLDPMNPNATKDLIKSRSENEKKLLATAESLGCSVEELIDSVVKGTVNEFISSKLNKKAEESEVKDNG